MTDKPMTDVGLMDAMQIIDSQIRDFDFHGMYDIFSSQEVHELRKKRADLQKQLEGA